MPAEERIYNRTVFWVIAVIGFVAFYFAGKNLFFFDEDIFIVNAQSAFMQQAMERSFLVKQCLKFEALFFGSNPYGYHIVSIVLHFLNALTAIMLFKNLLQYFNLNNDYAPGWVPVFFILFLFSPVHSEPLSYLLAQGVFIFALCSQLCMFFFIKGIQGKKYFIIIAALFFMFSLLCYEISWMLPLMLLCIVLFKNWGNKQGMKQPFSLVLPFFLLLILWFIIKAAFISKSLVADYENTSLLNIDLLKTCRNAFVLFVRNFIPPFKNTGAFISAALAVVIVLTLAVFNLYKKNKPGFKFTALLLLLTVFAFVPASLFGIDSHDSESERYIYFSSLFAMMLVAVLIVKISSGIFLQKASVAVIGVVYTLILFSTIKGYNKAGQFSKQYLNELKKNTSKAKTVYTINQPSQYKGALLLRALTRLPNLVGDNYTVLNEYMMYLYGANGTKYTTLTVKELSEPPVLLYTVIKPADSINHYFGEAATINSLQDFKKDSAVFACLRNDTLFIFR